VERKKQHGTVVVCGTGSATATRPRTTAPVGSYRDAWQMRLSYWISPGIRSRIVRDTAVRLRVNLQRRRLVGWLPHGYTRTLRPPRLRPPHTHIGGHNRQPTSHELSILVRENGRTGRGTLQRDDANRSTYSCPKFETAMRRAAQFASSRVLSRRP
jgi:hypothetical protein